MGSLSICQRRRRVRSGSDKRVSERHTYADLDEAGVDRRRRIMREDTERTGGAPHGDWITSRLGRSHGEKSLGRDWEFLESATKALLDLTRQRQLFRQAEAAREFGRGEATQ